MRVLMLAQNYAPVVGGEERMVEDLSLELLERGHDVSVATIRPPGVERFAIRDGIRIHAVRSSLYRARRLYGGTERPQAPPAPDPHTVLDLRRVLRRERPEVVHAHNWLVHSYLPLCRAGDTGLVLSLHDYGLVCATKRMLHRSGPCSGPGPTKCLKCAATHYSGVKGLAIATGVFASRRGLRSEVDMFLPVSRSVSERCGLVIGTRCRIVPNFNRPCPRTVSSDARLAQLPPEPYLLFVGDITPDKGALHLVDVYGQLERPPPLVLIGRCLHEAVRKRHNVRVLGPWPHELVEEAVRRCLFMIVPSLLPESFGLVALEGAAAGKAVVASNIGGLPEIVLDGTSGVLVAPGDPAALKAALAALIADDALRGRLAGNAAHHAARFRPEAIVPAFEDAYEAALVTRKQRSRGRAVSAAPPVRH